MCARILAPGLIGNSNTEKELSCIQKMSENLCEQRSTKSYISTAFKGKVPFHHTFQSLCCYVVRLFDEVQKLKSLNKGQKNKCVQWSHDHTRDRF